MVKLGQIELLNHLFGYLGKLCGIQLVYYFVFMKIEYVIHDALMSWNCLVNNLMAYSIFRLVKMLNVCRYYCCFILGGYVGLTQYVYIELEIEMYMI